VADVSAHRAVLSCSVQCHLLSLCCTFVIEQINDDDQSINQSILFAQNVQRYTYKAIQLRAGQQG